jgi:hypothetical protein
MELFVGIGTAERIAWGALGLLSFIAATSALIL